MSSHGGLVAQWRWRAGQPRADLRQMLYADPRSGYLLRNTAPLPKRQRECGARAEQTRMKEARRRVLGAQRQVHRVDGIWLLGQVAELPPSCQATKLVNGLPVAQTVCDSRWDVLRKAQRTSSRAATNCMASRVC